jgi:hypothetical protein
VQLPLMVILQVFHFLVWRKNTADFAIV